MLASGSTILFILLDGNLPRYTNLLCIIGPIGYIVRALCRLFQCHIRICGQGEMVGAVINHLFTSETET